MTDLPNKPSVGDKLVVGSFLFTVDETRYEDKPTAEVNEWTWFYRARARVRVGPVTGRLRLSYNRYPLFPGAFPFVCELHFDITELFANDAPIVGRGFGCIDLYGTHTATPEEALESVFYVLQHHLPAAFSTPVPIHMDDDMPSIRTDMTGVLMYGDAMGIALGAVERFLDKYDNTKYRYTTEGILEAVDQVHPGLRERMVSRLSVLAAHDAPQAWGWHLDTEEAVLHGPFATREAAVADILWAGVEPGHATLGRCVPRTVTSYGAERIREDTEQLLAYEGMLNVKVALRPGAEEALDEWLAKYVTVDSHPWELVDTETWWGDAEPTDDEDDVIRRSGPFDGTVTLDPPRVDGTMRLDPPILIPPRHALEFSATIVGADGAKTFEAQATLQLDRAAHRALAMAATQRHWQVLNNAVVDTEQRVVARPPGRDERNPSPGQRDDALHIAANSPPVVIALLDALDRSEAERDRARNDLAKLLGMPK